MLRALPAPVFKTSVSVPLTYALFIVPLCSDHIALLDFMSNPTPIMLAEEITLAFSVSNETATRPELVAAKMPTAKSVKIPQFWQVCRINRLFLNSQAK